jgi:hypothetical protein
MTDYRAEFDAEVTVLNGGGLQAQRFRLDIPSPDVSEWLRADFMSVVGRDEPARSRRGAGHSGGHSTRHNTA